MSNDPVGLVYQIFQCANIRALGHDSTLTAIDLECKRLLLLLRSEEQAAIDHVGKEVPMFSKEQLEAIRQALVLLESADQILTQARLPVLASSAWEARKCLSAAIALFKNA